MTKKELSSIGIHQWSQIESRYDKPDLLLGNGFSMKLCNKFSYNSLFEKFLTKCDPIYTPLFKQLNTTNFELILDYLTYAEKVNNLLGINAQKITDAIVVLRNGLIEAIKDIHPKNEEIDWDYLDRITDSLKGFGDIYTTNYDLHLYHIIMMSNDKHKKNKKLYPEPYQDYFWGDHSIVFKEFMSYQNYKYYKHIYYLHGSLFIFNKNIIDLKLKRNQSVELLGLIKRLIKINDFPLFISEGTFEDKITAIHKSNYLKFCFKKLYNSEKPILVFGNSLSKVDEHIFKGLIKKKKDIIISIYTNGRSAIQLSAEKKALEAKFEKKCNSIRFIDSDSIFN